MKHRTCQFVIMLVLIFPTLALGDGILPSLSETIGIAMPSIGDTLKRYPDRTETDSEGHSIEFYFNVTESEFSDFSQYLERIGASVLDYQVVGNTFDATVSISGGSFRFIYDYETKEAKICYQPNMYDERLKNAENRYTSFVRFFESGELENASDEISGIADYEMYRPLIEYLNSKGYTIASLSDEVAFATGVSYLKNDDYASAFQKWDTIQEEKNKAQINEEVFSYACGLVNENRVISALLLLRRVDEDNCNILRARIEGFLCSLFSPHRDGFVLKPDLALVDFSGKTLKNNVIEFKTQPIGYFYLKSDGTIGSTMDWGSFSDEDWNDVVDIQCGLWVVAGLRSDGTVVAEFSSDNSKFKPIVKKWKGIKQIAVFDDVVYGLKKDGTLVEAGDIKKSVKQWKGIIEIASNGKILHGRKKDGTIVKTASNEAYQPKWSDVLYSSELSKGFIQTKADGSSGVQELSADYKKYMKDYKEAAYRYLLNAEKCLALVEDDHGYGIIREDGTLVFLETVNNSRSITESSWKLWENETDIGKLFNVRHSVKLAKERGEMDSKKDIGSELKNKKGLDEAKRTSVENNENAVFSEDNELKLTKGKTKTIEDNTKHFKDRKLIWASSDESIATVKDGKVKAVNYGSCIITCTYEDTGIVVLSRNVTVFQEAKSIQAKEKQITLELQNEYTPVIVFQPDNTTYTELEWSSSNESVATVTSDGKIVSRGGGDCTVSAVTTDGSKRRCSIKVHVPAFTVEQKECVISETKGLQIPIILSDINPEDIKVFIDKESSRLFAAEIKSEHLQLRPKRQGKGTLTLTYKKDKVDISILNSVSPYDVNQSLNEGEIVRLGRYEQDGSSKNGKESIEWEITSIDEEGVAELTSVYIIDMQPWDKKGEKSKWKDSSLYQWLQTTFMKSAFSAEDIESIKELTLIDVACSYMDDLARVGRNYGRDADNIKCHPSTKEPDDYWFADWGETPRSVGTSGYGYKYPSTQKKKGVVPVVYVDLKTCVFD